jgi:hypothetical protein
VIAFANQKRVDTSLFPVVEEYHSRARGRSYVDYGFHLILTNPTLKILEDELPIMVECEGITNVKLYMTYPARRRYARHHAADAGAGHEDNGTYRELRDHCQRTNAAEEPCDCETANRRERSHAPRYRLAHAHQHAHSTCPFELESKL